MIIDSTSPPPKATIGGKAAGLYRLRAAGVPVPDFVVIPAETFDTVLAGLPTDAPGLDGRRQRLLTATLPSADEAALLQVLHAWGFPAQAVVVRSSIADEDGRYAAFAGLMDSFLNLITSAAVLTAVARCAASAYSERALAYRQQLGLPLAARPAVIVQRQVQSVVSGVLFTTFPEYPLNMAVHAVRGFGEALVSGAVAPDEFYLTKATGALRVRQLAAQAQLLEATASGGLAWAEVAVDADEACLSELQLAELYAIGCRLEQALGGPQDVEFVFNARQLWVVQARPITQAIPEVVVYDNANIQESYCGVTTPLTFSFAQRAYATVYRQTMRALGLPAHTIAAHETTVTQLLGLVQGRIYYNINNWYRGLQLLPSFQQNKADMERMMGLEEPVDFVQSRHKTWLEKVRLLPRLVVNLARLLAAFARLDRDVAAFHRRFAEHYRRFYALPLPELSAPELLAEKARLDTELLGRWTTPIINDFYVMMTNGRAVRRLRQAGASEPEALLRRYLATDQDLASTQPTRRMLALATQAHGDPSLRELILSLPADVTEQARVRAPEFARQVDEFIEAYGDRTVGELKLETQTMRTRPALFYTYLRNYLAADKLPTLTAAAIPPQAQEELDELLRGQSGWSRRRLKRHLRQLQQAIRHRESLRLERTRLFGMYRALYDALGAQLTAAGQLADVRDVFYLTEAEIAAALTSSKTATDWQQLVRERQQEFSSYAHQTVPGRVTVPAPPFLAETLEVFDATQPLRGTGCYAGQVQGEVLVVTSPDDNLNVAGKIVCALRTDPGWATLFPACRGIIIERGSSLSHSVIVLRELGIPTIINVPGLTQRLQSGFHISMDGTTGLINLLAHENNDYHDSDHHD